MLKYVFATCTILSLAAVAVGLEDAQKFKECRANNGSVSYCHLVIRGR